MITLTVSMKRGCHLRPEHLMNISLMLGWINFPKILQTTSKYQLSEDSIKQAQYWGPPNIWRHYTKFSFLGD